MICWIVRPSANYLANHYLLMKFDSAPFIEPFLHQRNQFQGSSALYAYQSCFDLVFFWLSDSKTITQEM